MEFKQVPYREIKGLKQDTIALSHVPALKYHSASFDI
jgi:hypothetical protein